MRAESYSPVVRLVPLLVLLAWAVSAVGCKGSGGDPRSSGHAATSGAASGDKPFALVVKPPAIAKPGVPAAATVTLEPRGGYKVNLEYPLRLTVSGSGSAKPSKQELGKADAKQIGESRVVLRPAFALGAPGEQRISGKLRFSVCTEQQCEIYAEDVAWLAKAR